jgi:N-acetylneuraminic acid mutarotase
MGHCDISHQGGRSSPQALTVRNNVIVVGGWGDIADVDVFRDVQAAAPRKDGSPAPWKTGASPLPTGIYGHATLLAHSDHPARDVILSIAGQPGTGAYANWITYAYVSNGIPLPEAIGNWRIASTGRLSSGRAGLGAVISGNRLYVIGGNDATGHFYSSVVSAVFDIGQPWP